MTVVLITRNGADRIEPQLRSVLSQEWHQPWELLVVDNESTDRTPELLAEWESRDARMRSIVATGAHSVAAARNAGARAARGRFVVTIDDDDEVGPGWLAALGDAVMANNVAVCRLDISRINDPVTRRGRKTPAQATRVDDWYGIPTASGATLAVRRDWYLELGGNDESLLACEDIEFGIRLYLRYGVQPRFVPEAVYHYRLKSTPREAFRQGKHYGKVEPAILRLHRHHIATQPRQRDALREWARLVATAPLTVFDPARRLRWSHRAGIRVGRVIGSVRERTLFL